MPIARDLSRTRHILEWNCATRSMIAGALVLVTGLFGSSAHAADDRAATVTGRVLDPLGGAIAHATVTLIRDQQAVSDAITDESGRFAVESDQSGRYQVRAAAPGFQSRDPIRSSLPSVIGSRSTSRFRSDSWRSRWSSRRLPRSCPSRRSAPR